MSEIEVSGQVKGSHMSYTLYIRFQTAETEKRQTDKKSMKKRSSEILSGKMKFFPKKVIQKFGREFFFFPSKVGAKYPPMTCSDHCGLLKQPFALTLMHG